MLASLLAELLKQIFQKVFWKSWTRINPADENWQRRHRMGQHLSPTIGQPHLDKLVAQMTELYTGYATIRAAFWRCSRKLFQHMTLIRPDLLRE